MEDLSSLKVVELKEKLKEKGLPIAGSKQELLKRLKASLELEEPADDLQETEEVIEHVVLQEEEEEDVEEEEEPDNDMTLSDDKLDVSSTVPHVGDSTESIENNKPKKITLSGLSDEERLKNRTEKFGVLSIDAKKQLRAERFGLSEKAANNTSTKISAAPAVSTGADLDKLKVRAERFGVVSPVLSKVADVDKLKQRAERFGGSVAPVLSKTEEQEKILKRQQRFGVISSTAATGDLEAKKMKRAERFGLQT